MLRRASLWLGLHIPLGPLNPHLVGYGLGGDYYEEPDCAVCRGELWMCEEHPGKAWNHDGCAGPGIPCRCNPDERMPPGTQIHCGE